MANALSYVKPPRDLDSAPRSVYALSQVKVGENVVKFTPYTKNNQGVWEVTDKSKSYKFNKTDLPKVPALKNSDDNGDYMVGFAPEYEGVEKISPAEAHLFAKVIDFMRPEEDADPIPMDKISVYDGKETPYQAFTPVFEVIKGKYKGIQVPYFLRYKFACDADGNAGWSGDPNFQKAIHLPRLVEFCEKTGCIDEPIEWPEDGNILPILLDRILKADRIVDITIKRGYVSGVMAADYEEAEVAKPVSKVVEEDDEFEEPKPKKPAPKLNGKSNGKKAHDPDDDL